MVRQEGPRANAYRSLTPIHFFASLLHALKMRSHRLSFVLLGLVFVASQLGVWAQDEEPVTVQVPVTRDAVIYAEDGFDTGQDIHRANGKGQSLIVGNIQAGVPRRTLIGFDLGSVVPSGSIIIDARLSMGFLNFSNTTFLSIYRMGTPWSAGTTAAEDEFFGDPAQTGDVTWIYRYFHATDPSRSSPWQTPGGDFTPDQPLLSDVGQGSGDFLSYTSEALVEDVQQMLNRPSLHHGWILVGDESSFIINWMQFASSENEDESRRPYLEVTYIPAREFDKVVTNYDEINTIAGKGEKDGRDNHWKSGFEGGLAIDAELSRPSTALAAEDGTIYFTDTYGHAIRKVTPDGIIETVAGTGVEGYNVDDGPALEVQLDQPNGLALMPNGNLYIIDIDNKRIRLVTPDGQLTTVFHDETEPPFLTGRGLWVSPDEQTIIYGSRTALKQWTAEDDAIEVLATGFERITNIGRDANTGEFLGADVDADCVWRINIETGEKSRVAGGGNTTNSGIPARDVKLEGVRGLAVSPNGGYFLTAEDGGDIWYVDSAGIAYKLLAGSPNGNINAGDGQVLRDLAYTDDFKVSQPFALTIAPNGDLVIVTNKTGFIRVVKKGRAPEITNVGLVGEEQRFAFSWTSQVQRVYVVEGSEDLVTWNEAAEVASDGNVATFVEPPVSVNNYRYYRVRFFAP